MSNAKTLAAVVSRSELVKPISSMRLILSIAVVISALVLLPQRALSQECYTRWGQSSLVFVSNPLLVVDFPSYQSVLVHWRTAANTKARDIEVHPGFPSQGAICPGRRNMDMDLSFDAPPNTLSGISFVWWQTDGRTPLPSGGPQDGAVRAYIESTLAFPRLTRRDLAPQYYPNNVRPRSVLDYEVLKGDTVRIGVTVRVTNGEDVALATMSWIFERRSTSVAAAPPKPVDPCSSDGLLDQPQPLVRTSSIAAREKLVTALSCFANAPVLLRAFYHGKLTSGVGELLADQLLPVVKPQAKTPADQNAQLVAIHERLLTDVDAAKVVRDLFAERAPSDAPLSRIEGELLVGSFRAATWSDALRRMDRHLSTGKVGAMIEARTEATLFLLSRRGEWTNLKIVQSLASFAPPLVGAAVTLASPLFEDIPATKPVQQTLDEAAPGWVDYALDKANQMLGFLGQLGVPGVGDVASSTGRIKAGVKIGTGNGSPLDVLSQALAALPQDDAIKLAKNTLGDLTKTYSRLSLVVGEPDRWISNSRFDIATQHFADRTASLPSIQGWIGAAGAEVRRTTGEMNARRDTVRELHRQVEARFKQSYEQEVEACRPNNDECWNVLGFKSYKVRMDEQQYHLAHLLDERAANLIEQRALCWRLTQQGSSNPACPTLGKR